MLSEVDDAGSALCDIVDTIEREAHHCTIEAFEMAQARSERQDRNDPFFSRLHDYHKRLSARFEQEKKMKHWERRSLRLEQTEAHLADRTQRIIESTMMLNSAISNRQGIPDFEPRPTMRLTGMSEFAAKADDCTMDTEPIDLKCMWI